MVIHLFSEYRIRGGLISIDGLHFSGLPQGLLFEPHLQQILRIGEDFHEVNRFFSDIYKEATAIGVGFLDLVDLVEIVYVSPDHLAHLFKVEIGLGRYNI